MKKLMLVLFTVWATAFAASGNAANCDPVKDGRCEFDVSYNFLLLGGSVTVNRISFASIPIPALNTDYGLAWVSFLYAAVEFTFNETEASQTVNGNCQLVGTYSQTWIHLECSFPTMIGHLAFSYPTNQRIGLDSYPPSVRIRDHIGESGGRIFSDQVVTSGTVSLITTN